MRADALDRVGSQAERHHQGWANERRTTFSYLGLSGEVAEERHDAVNANGTLSLQRSKSYGYDALEQRFGIAVNEASGTTSRYSYGRNVHGDISLLVDQAGAAKASYGYTPYGDEDGKLTRGDALKADGSKDPLNPFRFNDKRYDTGSGSIDMGARRFGPDLGRFLQRDLHHDALDDLDLATDPLTGNRYAFAGGNPISFVEVDGHRVSRHSTSCVGVGRLDCSLRAWTKSSWKQRLNWLGKADRKYGLNGWLDVFKGVVRFFGQPATFRNSDWAKAADGATLWPLARGLGAARRVGSGLRIGERSGRLWQRFFDLLYASGPRGDRNTTELKRRWGEAETAGIAFGVSYAARTTSFRNKKEEFLAWAFKEVTDGYRWGMRHGGIGFRRTIRIPHTGWSFTFGFNVPDPRKDEGRVYGLATFMEREITGACTVFRRWICRWHP